MSKKDDPKGIYRAVYCSIWDDPDFRKLNLNEKIVLLNLRTSPLSNFICLFPFYIEAIEKQTGLTRHQIQKAIDTLSDTLWITVEDGLCWIRNGLKYDPNISTSNPKHLESIRKTILSLPKLKIVFDFCKYYEIEIPYAMPYNIPYPIPYAIQEKEKEKEKEKDSDNDTLSPTLLPKQLALLWNELKPSCLPSVILPLNQTREKKAKLALRIRPDPEFWKSLLKSIKDYPFLLGENDRGWKADFEFILRKFDDVYEGKYKNNSNNLTNKEVIDPLEKEYFEKYGHLPGKLA